MEGVPELGGSADQELFFCLRYDKRAAQEHNLSIVDLTEGDQIWMAGLVIRPEDRSKLGVNYARFEDGSGISRQLRSRVRKEYKDGIEMYEEVGTPEFLAKGPKGIIDAFEKPVVEDTSDELQERNHLLLGGYIVSYFNEGDLVAGGVYFDRALMTKYVAALKSLEGGPKISGESLISEFFSDEQLLVLSVLVGSLISRRMPMLKMRPLFDRKANKENEWVSGVVD